MCRYELTIFGENLDWDSYLWPGNRFTKLGIGGGGKLDFKKVGLAEEFLDFAKAYVRYGHAHRPRRTRTIELIAIRPIEKALIKIKGTANISCLDVSVLDEAVALCKHHYTASVAYDAARRMEEFAKFVSKNNLIPIDLSGWKQPLKHPQRLVTRTGPLAQQRRDKKLPSQVAIDAIAEIFALNPQNPKDIYASCVFAMLLCAPSRISEILALPVDCEHEELDSKGLMRYGWRFYSGKGFGANIKWIPDVMVPVAKEAIKRIKAITHEPRRLAVWLESNSDHVYRHANTPDVADNAPLSHEDACKYLSAVYQAGKTPLRTLGLTSRAFTYTLKDLSEYIKSLKPKNFPWAYRKQNIKFSNALFIFNRFMLDDFKTTSLHQLQLPRLQTFNYDLTPSNKSRKSKSIFERYGYKERNGDSIKITSHQLRHLLNTIAQKGNLTQDALARWSGRSNPKQNRIYNHESEYELVAKAQALDTSLSLYGPEGELNIRTPLTRQELNMMERGPVHVTEFGVCVHDYTWSPCEKFGNCLKCEEHVCIKGNDVKLERIKQELAEVEVDYANSTKAIEEGLFGADRWHAAHQKKIERLKQLINILESPEIPNGTQIKLNVVGFSHLNRILQLEGLVRLEKNLALSVSTYTPPLSKNKNG